VGVLKRVRRIATATCVVIATISCGSPTEPSWNGQTEVVGSIRDFQSDAVIRGAHVTIGDSSTTTDATGRYSLTVPAGMPSISIDNESIGNVHMRDRTYRGDFFAKTTGCVGRYGTVSDTRTRRPIAGANISIGGSTAQTDKNGWFEMKLGCPNASCAGFNTTFGSVSHPDYATQSWVEGRGICSVTRVDYELNAR
jgi:hypothetical protein